MTEDEMVGWHHQLNGHESEQTPGMLQSMGLQRVGHNFVIEQQQQAHTRYSNIYCQSE